LKITKTVIGAPAGFTGSFIVSVSCTGNDKAYPNLEIAYPSPGFVTVPGIPAGNTCRVTETSRSRPPEGYTWRAEVISDPVTIASGEAADVTVANTLADRARVVTTVNGGVPSGAQAFRFELRKDASAGAEGTVLETGTAGAANRGEFTFLTELLPGGHYQACERVFPGWHTSLGPNLFVPGSVVPPGLPNPDVDNLTVCTDFVAVAGTTTFRVDRVPPPGGRAATAGFWKNWASCRGPRGKGQDPVLDETLATFGRAGLTVSATGPGPYPSFAGIIHLSLAACEPAARLLDRSTIDSDVKMAGHAVFNLAAQLVAAELNLARGAYQNGIAIDAVNQAVILLGKYGFDGTQAWADAMGGRKNGALRIPAGDLAAMNILAKILDDYNNNGL
jgi:hypothetical protein